jgi:hypothetical protein
MYGLGVSTLAVTAVATVAALFVTATHVGPGFVLYAAMLGDAIGWLLPVHVAVALPAGVFGGALLAGSGRRDAEGRARPADILTLTLVATLASAWLVGWMMPAAYEATAARSDRYIDAGTKRPETPPPAALTLSELLADGSAEARAEVGSRLRLTAPCLILGLVAAALVASPLAWAPRSALGGAAVAFLWQIHELSQRL